MKVISWNVNGLRACMGKGFLDFLGEQRPDFLAIQESKMQPEQAEIPLPEGYEVYWHSAERKGYSGVAVFTPHPPLSVTRGPGGHMEDHEGRLLTLEYENFYLVCCYTPNSQAELARIEFRVEWEDAVRAYLLELDAKKPVIYCGDLNVARTPIDLKNPKANEGSAGYSQPERDKMEELLGAGFLDSFRTLYPDREGAYSWWSYRFNARKNNAGWRIDYVILSRRLGEKLRAAEILSDVMGSDHCPVSAEVDISI